ncbi:MAG TPA: nucleotidyl transferase AbiEii/AbiGii toxin family protein [Chloroflexota bacterium]|nr:nucleotidyl transferase AbiEii/AbiGii toxin family protein [Chloroflexota bacterium]
MEIFTPFQKQILTAIGHSPLSTSFYLTGGTTLAAYYLQHRYSEDLDFFTSIQESIPAVTTFMSQIASGLGAEVEFTRTFVSFVECFISKPGGERVKLDFAFDTPYRLLPTQLDTRFGIQVDNLTDIACNKLSALFDRSEPKDFVDIYFICRELIPFAELHKQAQQKHVGISNYWLAMSMQNVRRIQFLPRMIKPLTVSDLQAFFIDLATELMSGIDTP